VHDQIKGVHDAAWSQLNDEANVQIEKKPSPMMLPLPGIAGPELPIAQQHLVDLPARLALMRWTRGGDIPHPPAPPREMWRRAVWYSGLQSSFQSWLKEGGFHTSELDDFDEADIAGIDLLDCRVTATNLTNTGQVAGIPGNTTRRK
jgi:hypothetical protein